MHDDHLFHHLESRRLYSTSPVSSHPVNISNHTAIIHGTGAADTIRITTAGDGFLITLNNKRFDRSNNKITAFQIDTGSGNDRVEFALANKNKYTSLLTEISTGKGDDTILATPGNDTIKGGDGNDDIRGRAGNDSILGQAGDDALHGDAGDDSLVGGKGNDKLWGGEGDDNLFDDRGNNALSGEGGDDILTGGPGNDTLWGGDGYDTKSPGGGHNKLDHEDTAQYSGGGSGGLVGEVTPDDYGAVDSNLSATGVNPGMAWFFGDTDFNGNITPDDYGAIDANQSAVPPT